MSVLNMKPDLNKLFPFAKKKPNIPAKLLDKVDTKVNKQKLVENENFTKTSESIRCDVLTESNEKGKSTQERTCINDNSKQNSLKTYKKIPLQKDDSEINAKKNKSVKSSNVSVIGIEDIKKPKENYQRWNIPFSSKFKGKDFDKTLLTMQDLIYYNPVTNPILKEPKVEPKPDNDDDDDPDGDLLSIDSDQKPSISNNCITPCIKVGVDGKIIIDQETLTLNETGLEEKREELAKAKVIEESAFHSRSYSYKRKKEPSKQWTKDETLKFYKCLMNLGTDFSMIGQYFPGRTRAQIKRKYKTEEKKNPQLINGALTNTTHYDSNLIENMFQETEPEETNVVEKSEVSSSPVRKRRLHKDVMRSECSKISLCGFMMEEEIVLKKKRIVPVNISTASNIKEGVETLRTLKGILPNTEKNIKKEKKLSKGNEKKDEQTVPKVRKLQDFHEEYEENINKYEEDSNSE